MRPLRQRTAVSALATKAVPWYGFCWFERGRELEPRTCCSRASFCHGKNSLLFARVTRLVSAPGSHATTSSYTPLQHRKAAPLHGSSDETLPSTTP